MATYLVTIIRTIETVVQVDAPNASTARREVTEYGVDLAATDYRVHGEYMKRARIQRIEAAA